MITTNLYSSMQKTFSYLALSLISTCLATNAHGQDVYTLWQDGPPSVNGLSGAESQGEQCLGNISEASLTVHHPEPDQSNGASILVIPGGAYWVVCIEHEGRAVADWLTDKGYTVGVLKYRLPNGNPDVPIQDAQQAVRFMRSQSSAWGINESDLGVLGFSAGGHLASSVGTHFEEDYSYGKGDYLSISSRPDFMILVYPVITLLEDYGHSFSALQLMGEQADLEQLEKYSNHLLVTEKTPPTILIHSDDDQGVHPFNSIQFYSALREANVPSEIHIFELGGHGYALDPASPSSGWTALVEQWLSNQINPNQMNQSQTNQN